MATSDSDLIGLHAFSRDGAKLGRVKRVIEAGGKRYLEIGGFLSRDIIVPEEGAKFSDVRVEVNYKNIFLQRAPEHRSSTEPSPAELSQVDDFYSKAA
jgi:ribosomal 30S subunit maturation factor RimM